MNIYVKGKAGFSLTELLVVVAITSVLTAISVVGYRGYIDSTKKSVTESNTLYVQQWFRSTGSVRDARLDVNPSACRNTLSNTAVGCITALTQAGAPFQAFKNSYNGDRSAASTIQAHAPATNWTQSTDNGLTACPTGIEFGDIIIEIAAGAGVNTTYQFWYCDRGPSNSKRIFTRDNWEITWY